MDLTENESEALCSLLQDPLVISQIRRDVICPITKRFAKT